jgi:hypothetical protein
MFPIITPETEIADATISGFMQPDGSVLWDINIRCEEVEDDGISVNPRLYIEKLKWDVRSIKDFINHPILINDGAEFCNNRIMPGVPLCCLYVFEHDFINENKIHFYKEDDDLYIKWSGHNKEYEVNLDTSIEFLGINLGDIKINDARNLLKFNSERLSFYREGGILYLIQD